MNFKRGIIASIALYILQSLLMVGVIFLTINIKDPNEFAYAYIISSIIVTVILTSLTSIWYFQKSKRNMKEGFKLGVLFVVVSIILGMLLSIILREDTALTIKNYFSIYSLFMFVIAIGTTVFIGSRNNHKKEVVKIQTKSKKK